MGDHQTAASSSNSIVHQTEIILCSPPTVAPQVSPYLTAPSSFESQSSAAPPTVSPEDNWSTRIRLFHAALSGDCEWVRKNILNKEPQHRYTLLNFPISTSRNETALHIAAGANQAEFVNLLRNDVIVNLISKDIISNTAFCSAIAAGAQKIVDEFLSHPSSRVLVKTRGGNENLTPLYMAASFGHGKIASQLYDASKGEIDIEDGERYGIFLKCIKNDLYDLAIEIFEDEKRVDTGRHDIVQTYDSNRETALHILSRKFPLVFRKDQHRGIKSQIYSRFSSQPQKEHPALELGKMIWNQLLKNREYNYLDVRRIINTPFNLVTEAAKLGNFDFLVMLLSCYPELIWESDESEKTIFHYAIMNRHVRIFNLIHEIGLPKSLIQNYEDDRGNNILHLAAKRPPKSRLDDVSGPALQLRQEILWFEEVKKIVAPSLRCKRNHAKKTPKEVFTAQHINLVKDGEKWMKAKAEICLIVATIIVGGILQTSFSVPSNDSESSSSQKEKNMSSILSIFKAVTMCFSSSAIILFLSILISRFTEREFLKFLPCMFIGGLVSLFISVIFMMASFCMTSFISDKPLGIPISVSSLQSVPVILFLWLVSPVLFSVGRSTFFSVFDFNAKERVLHYCESETEKPVKSNGV